MNLASSFGTFICLNENSANRSCMDITRIMVRVPSNFNMIENIKYEINGTEFQLIIREDSMGPLRISKKAKDDNLKQTMVPVQRNRGLSLEVERRRKGTETQKFLKVITHRIIALKCIGRRV